MKNNRKKSAVKEKKGVSSDGTANLSAIKKLKGNRKKQLKVNDLVNNIIKGDRVALSRAITLIESAKEEHFERANSIIEGCLPYSNKAIRIGITGVPGVGKSTFIEIFGTFLTSQGKKVAVLAVDPSSSVSKGSILGDKTRMEELAKDAHAFIRPSPSGATLGGVARKTRETIILCEACGFDTIIIETVGVGQSEIAVHSMVDFFLLLTLAGAGDELQGIKRGIMEVADVVIIHKADGENIKAAQRAKADFSRALHLYPAKENGWIPKALTASAIEKKGIAEIWDVICSYMANSKETGFFNRKRAQQNKYWLLQTIEEQLKARFYEQPLVAKELKKQLNAVEQNKVSPFRAAQQLFSLYRKEL